MLDKHQSHLVLNTLHFTLWYNIYVFFLKGWCPRCDIFKLTKPRGGGKSLSQPACGGRRSNCRGFSCVFKVKRSCSKAATTWKKGRWSLVVGCFLVGCWLLFFLCGGLFSLVVGWEGEEGKAK